MIHKDDPRVCDAMRRLGSMLNLREHGAGKQILQIFGPGDLEVHFGVIAFCA